jgi:hypothetical protein
VKRETEKHGAMSGGPQSEASIQTELNLFKYRLRVEGLSVKNVLGMIRNI